MIFSALKDVVRMQSTYIKFAGNQINKSVVYDYLIDVGHIQHFLIILFDKNGNIEF